MSSENNNNNNNKDIEQQTENKNWWKNCWVKPQHIIKIIAFIFAILYFFLYLNNNENKYVKIEEGPIRTINDYSYIFQINKDEFLFIGGYTYIGGSVESTKNAEIYNLNKNRFYKLQNTHNKIGIIKKTTNCNNKFLIESLVNKEIFDTKKMTFSEYDKNSNNLSSNVKNKTNITYIDENKISIEDNLYFALDLDDEYSILFNVNDEIKEYSCKLYNKKNKKILKMPKLKYIPFIYGNANSIKLSNKKFLIPLNYDRYITAPIYNTQIITIKE